MERAVTPAERVQAAIVRLEALKKDSAPGPWEGWKQYNPLRGNLYGIEARGVEVVKAWDAADVELIETLHRTIDAQLEILRGALDSSEGSIGWYPQFSGDKRDYALALAILGSES